MTPAANASIQSINVLIVIDTEYVKAHNPKQNNPNPNNPVGIDHNSQFMIANDPRGIIKGQGTADLNFKANSGDLVGFTGVSIYDNSDDAVIVYGITKFGGVNVFNPFTLNTITRKNAAYPNPNSPTNNGIPALNGPLNFNALSSIVANSGTENFQVLFALYTLGSDGNTQSLYGYFSWDPTITVQ
jgi:hypothetical protein